MTTTRVLDIRGESTGHPIHFDQEFTGTVQDAEALAQSLADQSPAMTLVLYFDGEHVATVHPIRSSDCLSLVLSGVAMNEDEAREILRQKAAAR